MMSSQFEERFAALVDGAPQFKEIQNKLHHREDLCAMLLLDKLVPGNYCMIEDAEHDKIFFSTPLVELNQVATTDDIHLLIACGVSCEDDGLYMFV